MKLGKWCLRASLLGTALFLPALDAHAQTTAAPVPAAASGESEGISGEIVVTARQRTERLIEVPVAATVLSAERLQEYSATNLSSIGTLVPQVMFTRNPSGNGGNINIRGVGTNTSADDGIEQAVSVNFDGVPTARGRILQTGMFDLANVQILRGPQALYFGKNSPGGTVIIESQGPTDSFEGYVRAGYEAQASEYQLEGAFGGPISDTFGYRVALRYSDMQEGYVRNVSGPIAAANNPIGYDFANGLAIPGRSFEWGPNSEELAGRVTLQWEPSPNFDATLRMFYSQYEDQGDASQNVIASCVPGNTFATQRDFSGGPGNFDADPYSYCGGDRRVTLHGQLPQVLLDGLPFNKGDTEYTENENFIASLTMNYHLGDVTLTSVSSIYNYDNEGNSFFDSTTLSLAGGGANSYYESWAQEFRLVSDWDGPFNVTAGLFYSEDSREYLTWSMIIRNLDPSGLSVNAVGDQFTDGETLSAFAELRWDITPELELAGGARWTRESKSGVHFNTFRSVAGALFGLAPGVIISESYEDEDISPQLTLAWRPSRDLTFFGGYRTGYKAGAISNPGLIGATFSSAVALIRPEEAEGFDLGVKFESDDGRLRGEVTAYSFTYEDLQVSAFSSVTNTVQTTNAGGAKIEGIEFNLDYAPTDQLSFRAAVGYNQARYETFTNAGCWGGQTAPQGCVASQQDLTGQPLPRAPDWAGTIGFNYDVPLGPELNLALSGDVRHTSEYNFISTNNPFAIQDGFTTLDASVRLQGGDGEWEVALIGRNLTDEFYFTVGSERPLGQSPGSVMGVPGLPRTVLVQATRSF